METTGKIKRKVEGRKVLGVGMYSWRRPLNIASG